MLFSCCPVAGNNGSTCYSTIIINPHYANTLTKVTIKNKSLTHNRKQHHVEIYFLVVCILSLLWMLHWNISGVIQDVNFFLYLHSWVIHICCSSVFGLLSTLLLVPHVDTSNFWFVLLCILSLLDLMQDFLSFRPLRPLKTEEAMHGIVYILRTWTKIITD